MQLKSDSRTSNLEFLRIICMLCIIAGHMLSQTSANELSLTDGLDYYILNFVAVGVRLAINVFVMIGAWFLVDLKFTADRILKMWLEIFFYSVLIDSLCMILNIGDASWIWEIQAFFPIMGRPIWFGAEYLCMLLLSPFLNELLDKQRGICKKVLIIFGIGIIGCATIFPIQHTTPFFSELTWFCFIYLFVGFIKRESMFEFRNGLYLLVWIGCWILIYSLKIVGDLFHNVSILQLFTYYKSHYENLISFVCAFCMFSFFRKLKIRNCYFINRLSKCTFAVYLIHQTRAFIPFLWENIFRVDKFVYTGYLFLIYIIIVIVLYGVALLTETIRIFIFEKLVYTTKIYCLLRKKINVFYDVEDII